MPIDISRIPALEEELRQARGTKPGGQEPRPERIAAIEEQLVLHRKEADRQFKQSRQAAGVDTPKREKPVKGEKETADATDAPAENARSHPAPEDAKASAPPENADEKDAKAKDAKKA